MVKYLNGQDTFIDDLEGDVNAESDCEGHFSRAGDEILKAKEEKQQQIRAVLITGSFAAYAIFNPVPFL